MVPAAGQAVFDSGETVTYGIRIVGLQEVKRALGVDFRPAIRAATQAIAVEVQGTIAPYPPASEANSPGNANGRWYERGYGPKWLTKAGVHGRKTSQMLGRRWVIKAHGGMGWAVGNTATYSPFVHSAEKQARFHAKRRWVTDQQTIEAVVRSGAAKRILVRAIVARIKGRVV